MKSKILALTIFLALVVGCYYLMAAVPTQPKVSIDAAVETAWDKHIKYTIDLVVSETVHLALGGIDTLRILHLQSLDTNTSGVYFPFDVYLWGGADDTVKLTFGEFTEFLAIGLDVTQPDSIGLTNPSASDTIGIEVLIIGQSE